MSSVHSSIKHNDDLLLPNKPWSVFLYQQDTIGGLYLDKVSEQEENKSARVKKREHPSVNVTELFLI